ncbi:MAG: PspC domain-containing protein [Acidimicrobiales bacterium]
MDPITNVNLDESTRPLRRPIDGRLVAGVAAGLADYLDVDVVAVRVVVAVLALAGGLGLPLYLLAWLLVPEEGAGESVADQLLHGRLESCCCPAHGPATGHGQRTAGNV